MGFLPSLDKNGFINKNSVPGGVTLNKRGKFKKKRKRHSQKAKPKPLKATDYYSYITSKKWAKRRRRYYATNPNVCKVCGSREDLQLHHISYENLGNEPDKDLVPLCNLHHEAFHDTIGGSRKEMRRETRTFIEGAKFDMEMENVMRNL